MSCHYTHEKTALCRVWGLRFRNLGGLGFRGTSSVLGCGLSLNYHNGNQAESQMLKDMATLHFK